ncbi:MAG: hypothetical protein AAF433_15125 [Bacteroidota bacterium]
MYSEFSKLNENPPQLEVDDRSFGFYRQALSYGLLGGSLLAMFLLIVNISQEGLHTGLHFAKYIVLIIPIYWAIRTYHEYLPSGKTFIDGFKLGASVAAIAAISVAVINLIIASLAPDFAFQQFYNANADAISTFANSVFLAFEIFVFGMIITFASLQLLKNGGAPE